jgi:biotin transport system ATP-binding protein
MTIPLLEIKHLSHSYPDGYRGILDISFLVSKQDFIILAGRNGSGKTTLIRHLNGLLRPSKGEVLLHGKNILKNLTRTRKTIGMVFQDADTQIVGDTVFDEVAFGPENLKLDRSLIHKKVTRILEQFDLTRLKDRNPATLSGGEKRKLAIAGILAMDPEIIVFDEPFANLDYPSTQSLLTLIVDLNKKGQTIIVATHDVETLLNSASRLLIMSDGRLVEDGSMAGLLDKLESHGVKKPCSCKITANHPPWQI